MSRSDRARGFTLLEVLAAVAVLGLIYTVLAQVGIQGFRAEGEADRRLRAALLADDRVTEIEGRLAIGESIPIGETEEEADDFVIRMRVSPAELTLPDPPESVVRRQREAPRSPGAAPAQRAAGPVGPAPSFFLPAGTGQPPPGRRIEVEVAWIEGATENSVVRETYGLDATAAEPLLIALDSAEEAAEEARSRGAEDARKRGDGEATEGQPGATPPPLLPRATPGAAPEEAE